MVEECMLFGLPFTICPSSFCSVSVGTVTIVGAGGEEEGLNSLCVGTI